MTLIKPFRALRPVPNRARDILAPPYDVLSTAEARERARGKAWSFLHVSRAEIDLPAGTDPYSDAVYARAAANLQHMIAERMLLRDAREHYYAYRTTWKGRRQTGLACVASVAEYEAGRIRKHELTTPAKEIDRARHIEALNAQTGPVMMAYPPAPDIDRLLRRESERDADAAVTADNDVMHELWVIDDPAPIEEITNAFDALPALYIADGHHRSAAAQRVAAARGPADGAHRYFLSVIFPHHSLTILEANRVVRDLNGRTPEQLLAEVGERFTVTPATAIARPSEPREIGMYVDRHWYLLKLRPQFVPENDVIGGLPATLLARNLIEPILGIADQRTDARIDVVGGARGLHELVHRVDLGEMAVAFALFPTSMDQVMAVADANAIMPPKSTWFEPKLADGMVSHVLD